MSVLITGDLHWSDNDRDTYRHNIVPFLETVAKKYKVKCILLLGDLTEAKDRHSAWLVNTVTNHLTDLAKIAPVIIVQGNHDGLTPDNPFFRFAGGFSNVSWIGAPQPAETVSAALAEALRGTALLLPHTPDYQRDWKGIDRSRDYYFCHQTFTGAVTENGRPVDGGVPLDFLPGRVISGDIHVPQVLGNVKYVGAPYHVKFGDSFKARVLVLKGSKTISVPYTGPQKQLLKISSLAELQTIHVNNGDIVKVRYEISAADRQRLPEIRRNVREYGENAGFVVHSVEIVFLEGERRTLRSAKRSTASDDDVIRAFARRHKVGAVTLKTGLAFLDDVSHVPPD